MEFLSRVSEFLGTASFVILKLVYNPNNTFLPKIPDKIDEGLGAQTLKIAVSPLKFSES